MSDVLDARCLVRWMCSPGPSILTERQRSLVVLCIGLTLQDMDPNTFESSIYLQRGAPADDNHLHRKPYRQSVVHLALTPIQPSLPTPCPTLLHQGHTTAMRCLTSLAQGQLLATGAAESSALLWDMATTHDPVTLKPDGPGRPAVSTIMRTADGCLLVLAKEGTWRLYLWG